MKKPAHTFSGPVLCVCLFFAACGPSEEKKAQLAEKKRIDCLDKFCEGDVTPSFDSSTETLLKLNGQWFIGPREYFSTGINGASFEWWNHKPSSSKMKRAPEAQALVLAGQGYDISVELFLRHHETPIQGPTRYEQLKQAEAEGRLVSKATPRPDLEVWHIRETSGLRPGVWYVATALKGFDGQPPVLWCSENDPKLAFCTTGFIWKPGIAGDMRFHSKHGPDWPDIYQETTRVLQKIKKA